MGYKRDLKTLEKLDRLLNTFIQIGKDLTELLLQWPRKGFINPKKSWIDNLILSNVETNN